MIYDVVMFDFKLDCVTVFLFNNRWIQLWLKAFTLIYIAVQRELSCLEIETQRSIG